MSKVEGGGGPIDLPPPSRPRVTIISSRLLGLSKIVIVVLLFYYFNCSCYCCCYCFWSLSLVLFML